MAGLTQASDGSIFGMKTGSKSGKSAPEGDAGSSPRCPQCGSTKVWRDGLRYPFFGDSIQRWLCRNCGLRFSKPSQKKIKQPFYTRSALPSIRQICAQKAKNLEQEQVNLQVPGMNRDTKGILVQYAAKMDLEGYSTETIRGAVSCLRALITRKADLNDPESVKLALAKEEKKEKHWSQNRRRNVINAYTLFLRFQGKSWIKPKCTVDEKFPFIPTEAEIDALIAGSHRKLSALLQLLKETAIRSGEAHRIEWTDVDAEQRIITINKPEKHSNARMFKVSAKLIEMLSNLPKRSTYVFNCSKKGTQVTLQKTRTRLAEKLGNPRLLKIHLHTFRHWKATMLYHELKDAHYVQHFLGHKSIKSTEKYINIEHTIFQTAAPDQKWIVKVTADPKEIAELIADGFEAHCNQGDLIFLRKRT
jgi:integrase/ribosomal protein L37AE/L43A